MKNGLLGVGILWAMTISVATMTVEQQNERPLTRSLTVEQKAVYDAIPPPRPATAGGDELRVLAWVDRPDYTYASGEGVRVFVETNKDAYVTVLNVDPTGESTVLFPNRYQSDNFVAAGRPLQVPAATARFRIVVSGNVGTELLKVIASTRPIPLFEARQLAEAGPFQVVRAQPAGLARSLTVVMTNTSTGSAAPVTTTPARLAGSSGVSSVSSGSAATVAANGFLVRNDNEWATCHQAITTVSRLSAAARRTRSLTVQRTEHSVNSVTCEEVR
ncbi:MAG: DUF4384 domain-containing protein [Acidobacteria bacterium]|nr:DUF4384 domain-containing protein [Acidobacteriota bacterium]